MIGVAVCEILDQSRERVDTLDKRIQELFDKVNSVLEWVPSGLGHLVDGIVEGMKWLAQKVNEFWDEIRPHLDNTGNPCKLKDVADAWRDDIGNKIGPIADDVDEVNLASGNEWTDSGALAYHKVARAQKGVLDKLKAVAITLAETLEEMAVAIENFWIAYGLMIVDLTATLVLAIAEAVSVIALPGVPPTVVAGITIAIGLLGFAVTELKGFMDTNEAKQKQINQQVTDLGDEWAKATPESQKKIDDPSQWEPVA